MVAVDGTRLARVAGRRLPRLLRGALVAIGLSGLIWLLGLLIGSGTAAADPPPAQPTHSTGLLGGLVGGLTSTLGSVLDTTTSTVGQVLGTASPVVVTPPVFSPPVVRESPLPQPESVPVARHAPTHSAPRASTPEATPQPAPSPPATTPVKHAEPVVHNTVAPVRHAAPPVGPDLANPSGPAPSPDKSPSKPFAPAVPTGSVSAGHDGPGQARNSHGVLAGQSTLEPPAQALRTHGHAADAGDPAAGLPATAPD